ncbi:MAG: hypothetical protein JJE04_25720 [Acidobacteriia bacterium]|nr:hypothetical protein [Terriglobia bacterium]
MRATVLDSSAPANGVEESFEVGGLVEAFGLRQLHLLECPGARLDFPDDLQFLAQRIVFDGGEADEVRRLYGGRELRRQRPLPHVRDDISPLPHDRELPLLRNRGERRICINIMSYWSEEVVCEAFACSLNRSERSGELWSPSFSTATSSYDATSDERGTVLGTAQRVASQYFYRVLFPSRETGDESAPRLCMRGKRMPLFSW